MNSYGVASAQGDLVRGTIAEVKGLTVDRLKKVLRQEGLQVSGIKNELQIRLIAHIENAARQGDNDKINRLKGVIRGLPTPYSTNPYPSPYSNHTPASSASPQFTNSPTPRLPMPGSSYSSNMAVFSQNRITFKNSPFYTISRSLSSVQELKAREQTRDTARVTVTLDASLATQLQIDPNLRIMVFCAAETFEPYKPLDISFPHHGELKCNQEEVKANLKGLKNKTGSTRPADVTSFIRKKGGFPNTIELVYALTTKASPTTQKFYLVVNLVQKRPTESLVDDMKRGKFISKDRVIREMQAKASDPDIIATSTVMSLKDPVQMTRIQTPCRSIACTHNQCFDAAVYLALQEQAPTWTCPICNKSAMFENLAFDQYFDDILQNTKSSDSQVTIEPDGRWHLGKADNSEIKGEHDDGQSDQNDDEEDDDLIEIKAPRPPSMAASIRDFERTPSVIRTPPLMSKAVLDSAPSSSQPQRSNKRPRSETIDLTLSDDDDDEQPPVSRIKRPSFSSQPSDMSRQRQPETFSFQLPFPPQQSSTPSSFYEQYNTRM